jgi:membrane protease YdiL (CAAX protease family)
LENLTESITPEKNEKRMPTPLGVSILYLSVLALMLLTSLVTDRIDIEGNNYYIFMFVIQLIAIGLPPLLYMVFMKIDIKAAVRLNRISLPEILLSAGMAIFGYGIIIFLNLLWITFLTRLGTPQTQQLPPIETGPHFLMAIAVIGGMPALLEEFLFRGVMQRGYERFGRKASILLTGILFAFLHISIVSIPAIIMMGILLCYISYRADSIWAGAVYHFTNNTIAVVITYLSSLLTKLLPAEGMSNSLADIPPETLRMAMMAWGIIGSIALILFTACFAGFTIVTRGKQKVISMDTGKTIGQKMLQLLPAALAVVIIIVLLVFEVVQMVSPSPVMQLLRFVLHTVR